MRLGEQGGGKISFKLMLKIALVIFGITAVLVIIMTIVSYFAGNKVKIDIENASFTQLDPVKDGQETAVIKTSLGEMKLALFREFAPNTVENFVTKAMAGYYDGTLIMESEPTVYFIGGNTADTNDKTKIENEISPNLWPFKGAVCSIGNDRSINGGNNLLFVNSIEFTDDIKEQMKSIDENGKLSEQFIENGGIPNFVGQYTVFAQVYEGMDVFEKISNAVCDEESKQPVEYITIESIIISTYSRTSEDTEKS